MRARKVTPPRSIHWMRDFSWERKTVMATLKMKSRAAMTMKMSRSGGISNRGVPCVHPNRKPTTATTAVPAKIRS